jgi:hypothetical protein
MRGSVKNTQIIPIIAQDKVSKKYLPGSMNIYVMISNVGPEGFLALKIYIRM